MQGRIPYRGIEPACKCCNKRVPIPSIRWTPKGQAFCGCCHAPVSWRVKYTGAYTRFRQMGIVNTEKLITVLTPNGVRIT